MIEKLTLYGSEPRFNQNIDIVIFRRKRLMCMFHTVYSLCYIDNFVFVFLYILVCVDTFLFLIALCYQYNSAYMFYFHTFM